MDRRRFVAAALAALSGRNALAQAARVYRIGYLTGYSAQVDKPLLSAFTRGLRELGYLEGKNLVIEAKRADGDTERLERLAGELAASKPDIFVVGSGEAAVHALKKVSGKIPIVLANLQDPLGSGVVTNLARPGGNITGLSDFHAASVTKRLELLKEAVSSLKVVGVLWNPDSATNARQLPDLERSAPALGLKIVSLPVRSAGEIDGALARMKGQRNAALLLLGNYVLTTNMGLIARRAVDYRMPAVYTIRAFADAGGFMAYGANFEDLYRRSATFVDKILKGANAGDLPIEQATKFDLIVNERTARAIGVAIPQAFLVRADEVIR